MYTCVYIFFLYIRSHFGSSYKPIRQYYTNLFGQTGSPKALCTVPSATPFGRTGWYNTATDLRAIFAPWHRPPSDYIII